MAIYVAHVIFEAGVRVVLLEIGVRDLGIHLLAGFIAGLAGPLLLQFFSTARGLDALFRFLNADLSCEFSASYPKIL